MALAIALRSSRPFQFFFSTRHRSYVRSVYARRRLRVHPCLLTIQHGRTFFHLVVSIFSFSFLSFSFFLIPVFRSGTTSRRSYSTELPFQRVSSYCSGYRSTDSSVVQAKKCNSCNCVCVLCVSSSRPSPEINRLKVYTASSSLPPLR